MQIGSSRGSDTLIQGRSNMDKDKEVTELQKDFFLLEGKIKNIESSFNDKLIQFTH